MKLILARSIFLSALLHVLAFGLLLVSLDLTPTIQPALPKGEIIDAVTVDNKQVEQELARLKEADQQKQNEQLRKQQELERKAADLQKQSINAEQRRKQEELRLADLKQKQQDEEKKRKEEELKLADAKKQQEELKQQQELDQKRKQETLAKAEADRKKKEAEEALKKKLAEEQAQMLAAQDKADMNVINQYVARIANAIQSEFNMTGLPPGLSCVFLLRMSPGGDVVSVRIDKSSGNTIFDTRAETAVKRAAPLPVPEDARIFAKMREIRLTFAPI